jgi:predicted phage terminase large subunit-like protein
MKNNNNIQSKVAALEQAVIERRRLLCRDFLKFRKQYFQGYHGFSDAAFHHEIAGLLQEITKQRGARVAIAAPRESAKSTIVTLQWVIYCICYKLEKFIVIASNTKEQAMNYLSNIKVEFLTNAELRRDFPEVLVEEKPKRSRLAQEEIITSTGIRIMVRGSGQSPRGFRNKADRPTLIILDDIEGSELSVESLYKLEDWVTKDLFKSGSPLVNVVCVGTIHHYASLLAKFTDPHQYHGWQQKVYRSVISWADNQKLWEQWKRIFRRLEEYEGADGEESARKFFEANKEEMLKGTQVLWPESKGYYALMVMIEKEGEISFNSEMQNNPVNERDAHFTVGEYQYWDDHYADAEDLIRSLKNSSYVSIVGACDPSMGKARGDRSAIITLLKDHGDDRMYVIDADITRRKPNKILEDIVEYHRHRRYMRFAFETNQAQEAMAAELEKQSMDAGIPLSVIPIQHNKVSKISRIQALQVPLKLGRLVLCRKHLNLLEEMKCFPKGQHEDGLDALEMAYQIAGDYQGGTVGPIYPIYPSGPSVVMPGVPDLRAQMGPDMPRDRQEELWYGMENEPR